MASYEYELRDGDAVIATGRIQLEEQPSQGDELRLGRDRVRVDNIVPTRAGARLILARVGR